MNYWQFKFNSDRWENWENIVLGDEEDWQAKKTVNKNQNDISIGDIVFIYRSVKRKGIYFVAKVNNVDFEEEYPLKLEIIKDLRGDVFIPENFGFSDVVKKINKLNQNGSYYKFLKNEHPEKIFDLIMTDEYIEFIPEEINENESKALMEGAKKQITVNAFERNPKARQECVKKHGYICAICKFDFEKSYGEIGKNFIHVHHLREISSIAENYKVDPKKDLIPVCPNCHAMLHKKKPAYTINEMKKILNK